jgi:hypothetical protein
MSVRSEQRRLVESGLEREQPLLTLVVHARIPIPMLRQMIYAYPTFHKGVEHALGSLAA